MKHDLTLITRLYTIQIIYMNILVRSSVNQTWIKHNIHFPSLLILKSVNRLWVLWVLLTPFTRIERDVFQERAISFRIRGRAAVKRRYLLISLQVYLLRFAFACIVVP